ncbi:MAG: hypothetical protein AB2L22_12175 [Syntrophales bacterium]
MTGPSRTPCRLLLSCLILALGVTACAQVKVNTLPEPPPTAKLRVFFLTVSDTLPSRMHWATSHKQYTENMARPLSRFLGATGIYEVVPQGDVDSVLEGRSTEDILWQRRNWELARRVGRALHADYVVVARRGFQGFLFFQTLWINLETGKVFESKDHPGTFLMGTGSHKEEFRKIVRQTYFEIFRQAKGDLLATAIRKGRTMERMGPPGMPAAPVTEVRPEKEPPAETPAVVVTAPKRVATDRPGRALRKREKALSPPEPAVEAKKPSPPPFESEVPAITGRQRPAAEPAMRGRERSPMVQSAPETGKMRIVVYDLETTQPMQVAGLIITEALREEILKLGSFDLVNREDLARAMDELKLQQSGLVGEKEAVTMGRWLAARQSVTGRLGSLGSTTVLQTKRTDIETMGTLSIGSLKAAAGREEDLLEGLPDLAKKLTQK